MTIGIIGLGLIGGSAGVIWRNPVHKHKVLGYDVSTSHSEQALRLKLIDEQAQLDTLIRKSDVVVLSIPVNAATEIMPRILDGISNTQSVVDMGSTKQSILHAVQQHNRRPRFVAAHPMWGTEFSGPAAAQADAFAGKAAILCNVEENDADALENVTLLLKQLGLHLLYMDAKAHDLHTAYISHISHITSFALANTVLEKEKEESAIFELASAGFESTVRLAKSNPDMWLPIFQQNKENVLDVLNEHIVQLRKFKACLEKENWSYLYELMQQANNIKRILD